LRKMVEEHLTITSHPHPRVTVFYSKFTVENTVFGPILALL
jgi:hypothetical protein